MRPGELNRAWRISIHAPREGRDAFTFVDIDAQFLFQSTRPVRGATRSCGCGKPNTKISIHAPREGRDRL